MSCDALILEDRSHTDTYSTMEIDETDAHIGHAATVTNVVDDHT